MRWLRLTAAVLGAAGLAWLAVLYGLSASALDSGEGKSALALRPHSAAALSCVAEETLAQDDYPAAARFARAALVQVPRDVVALRVMGLSASLQDQRRLGSELLLRAGTLSWRDEVTQVWLIRAAMDQQNFATAAQRLDAMLRSNQMHGDMLKLAHSVATIPEARTALVERLMEGPPWRKAFFRNMESLPRDAEAGHVLLIDELRTREGALPRSELVRFVRRLVEQGDARLGQQVWYKTLSAEGQTKAKGLFDGDFSLDPTVEAEQPRFLFEWDLESGGGAMSSIGTPPMLIEETALNVITGDSEQIVARQTIALEPGQRRLSYAVAGEGQGIGWRVLCVGRNRVLTLSPPATRKSGEWRTIERSFEVPDGCPAQRLEILALPTGGTSNEFWLDHVSVQ